MRKSGAQRQAEYRQRHLKDETGTLERLNLLVQVSAKRQLERLAYCDGVTQRAMLEKLLAEAERATLDALSPEEQAPISTSGIRYAVTHLQRHRDAQGGPLEPLSYHPGTTQNGCPWHDI
jgi:hypothetical protein